MKLSLTRETKDVRGSMKSRVTTTTGAAPDMRGEQELCCIPLRGSATFLGSSACGGEVGDQDGRWRQSLCLVVLCALSFTGTGTS